MKTDYDIGWAATYGTPARDYYLYKLDEREGKTDLESIVLSAVCYKALCDRLTVEQVARAAGVSATTLRQVLKGVTDNGGKPRKTTSLPVLEKLITWAKKRLTLVDA